AVVAATGITVATGGLGCFLLGAVVGTIVGLAMSKTGADKGLTNLCDSFSNALFPPTVQANILTGSTNTLTNNIRAAGAISSHVAPAGTELEEPAPAPEASYLDMAESFFSQMWRPTVATPAPGAVPKPLDLVVCMKHPPMPPAFWQRPGGGPRGTTRAHHSSAGARCGRSAGCQNHRRWPHRVSYD
ncbi:hypothetical protein, partial [Pseudomonas orientalis]|uniref:hypothetical protein n=1 Tax=Pseudomonas orientalis TaxID=76758 RepID=UPI000714DAD9